MTDVGTTSTLGKVLKDQMTRRVKIEIVRKKLQLRESIQRFPDTRLALPPLEALYELNCLSHKLEDGARPVILIYAKIEVTSRLSHLSHRLPKRVPHRFTLVPVRNVSLA